VQRSLYFFLQLRVPAIALNRKFLHYLMTARHFQSFVIFIIKIFKKKIEKIPAARQQLSVLGNISFTRVA
jgi:hypothetical protein